MNFLNTIKSRGMATSCRKLEFYYDVVSPFSWYAFEILQRYEKRWNLEIDYKPVLLGGIFKATNNSPPGVVAAKARNGLFDLRRCSKYYKVPLHDTKFAELLTEGSMRPMRFVTAVKMHCPKHLLNVSRQFWMKRFNSDEDFNPLEAIKDVATKAGMQDAETEMILSKITTGEVKQMLIDTSNEAVAKGGFGVPMIVTKVDGKDEMFFGSDRFPMLAEIIGEEWAGPDPDMTSKL